MTAEITRTAVFFFFFFVIAFWEFFLPRKVLSGSKKLRWFSNLSLIFIGNFFVKILIPLTALSASLEAQKLGFGLLNYFSFPYFIKVMISLVLLDFVIYFQHLIFHKVSFFWKVHRVHHADTAIDVTTALRFHPFEIIFSLLIKVLAVFLFGIPLLGVFLFEIVLNATAMFNHGNIKLPKKLDRFLRFFIVTPDMHRVHHSVYNDEMNRNFGFNLPWWDYLLGTYKKSPRDGQKDMKIGLKEFRQKKYSALLWILVIPFLGKKSAEDET